MAAEEMVTAVMVCPICGKRHTAEVPGERMKERMESAPQICRDCEPVVDVRNREAARESELQEAKARAMDHYRQRLEESQLELYELGFDEGHPQANTALFKWMIRNLDRSVWVYGATGLGKTRAMQCAARWAVRDRSVRYWPAFDLTARLTETSKRPETQLRDLYAADLLVIDDLGISNMTEARLTALTSIVDRRYIGWDQVRRAQGAEQPTFGWSSYGRRRTLGGQIWISSQVPPEELVRRLSCINATDAAALVRRLADMCVIHEAEAIR